MASKSDKETKDSKKSVPASSKENSGKTSPKSKKQVEDDEDTDDENFETPKPTAKKGAKPASKSKKEDEDVDDDDDVIEEVDEWEKVEEEEEWDPDFDEFDIPKSKIKKSSTTKKGDKGGTEEDELGLDEEFKDLDLFNEGGFDEEEEDF
jgi:DNA-directed RNA polymerase subunit delta